MGGCGRAGQRLTAVGLVNLGGTISRLNLNFPFEPISKHEIKSSCLGTTP